MANVAGVSQLMEIVGVSTNQAAAPTPSPEHSFATVMQQANSNAGVPAAPVEQKAQPKQSDARHVTGQTQEPETASAQAVPSAAEGTQAASAVVKPQQSQRYTPANMIAAMGAHSAMGAAPTAVETPAAAALTAQTAPSTALPLAQAFPTATAVPSVSITSSETGVAPASLANGDATVQIAALDAKPVDLYPPAVLPSVSINAAKGTAKGEASTTHAPSRAVTKQNATMQVAEAAPATLVPAQTVTALLAANAPPVASAVMIEAPVKPLAVNSATAGKTAASPAALPAAPSAIPSGLAGLSTQASGTAQTSAATFKQSLSVPQAEPITASVAAEHPLAAAGNQQSAAITIPWNTAATAAAQGAAPVLSAMPASGQVSVPARQPAASQPLPAISDPLQASSLQPAGKPVTAPKAGGKPSLSTDAPQQTGPVSQTAMQSTGSASPADGKAMPHAPVAALIATAAPSVDGTSPVITPVAMAHTPVAVTALSTPTGPALATVGTAGTTLTTTTADAIPHTTLSSTPTTLEVGVSSGTHGWLKIRAELNASGTVDASLTGTNAAATGRLHNDLPALSSFLQDEKVAVGSLNISAPSATASALHAVVASTLEPTSSFTRSAAEGVGATGTAVASDAGTSGGRAPQQQASESSPAVPVAREDEGAARATGATVSGLYGEVNDMVGSSGALSESGYDGGSWLNVRV